MNKIIVFFCLLMLILSGCTNKEVTKEAAEQIVIHHHLEDNHQIEIVYAIDEKDKYIIKWENAPNHEGVDSVHKKNGKVKKIQSSYGSCQWR